MLGSLLKSTGWMVDEDVDFFDLVPPIPLLFRNKCVIEKQRVVYAYLDPKVLEIAGPTPFCLCLLLHHQRANAQLSQSASGVYQHENFLIYKTQDPSAGQNAPSKYKC